MTKVNILDKVIKRYHATNEESLKSILKDRALKPTRVNARTFTKDGSNYAKDDKGSFIYEWQDRPIFTSVGRREWVNPGGMLLEIEIPGSKYVNMKRTDINPDYIPSEQYRGHGYPWKVFSVDHKGTADFFLEDIPLDYVKRICLDGTRKCYDVDKVLDMYGIEK